MSTYYLGLKLGSNNTWIYKTGNGLVLREPTLVAVSSNPKDREVKAIGIDAKSQASKTSDDIVVISPISNGIIAYEDLAAQMLKGFLKKIVPVHGFGQKIKAILCVPLGISAAEKKKFEITCFKAGITDVFIVPDILAYAVGSEMSLQSDTSQLIVNIGGDTTNIAVISGYTIVNGYSFSIGGSLINVALAKYIEESHGLRISQDTADYIKREICSLLANYSASITVPGLNVKTKMRDEKTISSTELYPIVEYYYAKIVDAVISLLSSCDNETRSEIFKNGIYYFGGATSIVGFERYMMERTRCKVNFSNMTHSNIVGVGELIKYPQILKRIVKNN